MGPMCILSHANGERGSARAPLLGLMALPHACVFLVAKLLHFLLLRLPLGAAGPWEEKRERPGSIRKIWRTTTYSYNTDILYIHVDILFFRTHF